MCFCVYVCVYVCVCVCVFKREKDERARANQMKGYLGILKIVKYYPRLSTPLRQKQQSTLQPLITCEAQLYTRITHTRNKSQIAYFNTAGINPPSRIYI